MKAKTTLFFLIVSFFTLQVNAQKTIPSPQVEKDFDYITALIDTLNHLSDNTGNEYFRLHCESMVAVIEAKSSYSASDSAFIESIYTAFNDETDTCNAKDVSTYLKRRRSFILSWVSPTDGAVSFSWMKLPANWDPDQEYPLYIQLHGLWSVASNSIEYLSYPFLNNPSTSIAFEDGYLLSPWGRGNLWYQGISETDIWECMAAMEEIVTINPIRKYLSGHSMGGYGAWHIAIGFPNTWAALGIHAGALYYGGSNELNSSVAEQLRDLPTYFVCGTSDGLLSVNQTAYQLLLDAGNQNVEFVTFGGGHEYLEENVINMYLWMREFVNYNWSNPDIHDSPITSGSNYINFAPNPFHTEIQILFSLPESGYINLDIYTSNGQKIKTLVAGELSAGEHRVSWIPQNLPNGYYFCILKTNDFIETGKLIHLK